MIPTVDLVAGDWNVITLPDDPRYNIIIEDGDFYVGWFEASNSSLIGVDTDVPVYNRSWQYTGSTWYDFNVGIPQNFMMRAIVDTLPQIQARFTADEVSGTLPHVIHFTDQSTNVCATIVEWNWNFGDGQTSSEQNPTHIYQNSGRYSVSLSIVDENDSTSTINKEDYINIYPQIWPGDTDNNGIVDTLDILPIGIYFRSTGNARENISYNWMSNEFPALWEDEVAAPADCNGDGIVDISDVLAIGLNMGKSHSVSLNIQNPQVDIDSYKRNFIEIYNSLGDSESDLIIKNFIARRIKLHTIEPEVENVINGTYPNPFSATTTIKFSLKDNVQSGYISIYNVKGQLIKKLNLCGRNSGENMINWNGRDLNNNRVGNGIYLYVLTLDDTIISTKRMILMK